MSLRWLYDTHHPTATMSTSAPHRESPVSPFKRLLHAAIVRFDRWYFNRFQLRDRSINGRLDRFLRAAARLYARYELPSHIQILEALLINRTNLWRDMPRVTCRGCWHGYTLNLNPRDQYQRWSYFLSRYHEVPLQLLLRAVLRPGDTFIDGGANNGLITMVGAWLVGPRGRVVSFEPNQVVYNDLDWHVRTNKLAQVIPIRAGLSDEPGELTLQVPGDGNLGAGTFAEIPGRYKGLVSVRCTAPILVGDHSEHIKTSPGEMVLKLDVEGFECRALRGLSDTIDKRRPLVFVEANAEMLTHAGSSIQEVRTLMESRGYLGYSIASARAIIRHRRVVLTPISDWSNPPPDICWVLPGSTHAARLASSIRS